MVSLFSAFNFQNFYWQKKPIRITIFFDFVVLLHFKTMLTWNGSIVVTKHSKYV